MRYFLCVFIFGLWLQPSRAECMAWFGSYWQKFGGSYRERPTFSIDTDTVRVEFSTDTFWTITRLFYKNELMGQDSGGTGTVVHWDGKPVGTVHRDGNISEHLRNVELTVDGRSIPLAAGGTSPSGQITATLSATWSGKQIILTKRSVIGPFQHQAQFIIDSSSTTVKICHDYEALEEITPQRFSGYRYVFMHMMPLDMTEWLTVNGDATTSSGSTQSLGSGKNQQLWQRSIRGLACYSPTRKLGMAYAYPQSYPGESHFIYREGKDIKFRGILFDRDHYEKGEKLHWELALTPFAVNSENWQSDALKLLGNSGETLSEVLPSSNATSN